MHAPSKTNNSHPKNQIPLGVRLFSRIIGKQSIFLPGTGGKAKMPYSFLREKPRRTNGSKRSSHFFPFFLARETTGGHQTCTYLEASQ